MADTLLPCPFCGGPVELEEALPSRDPAMGERRWWGVVCRNTTNLGGTCAIHQRPSASKEAAIERWNQRSTLASRPAEVDDSQLRNVSQFLLDRYDELRNKKGAPSTAEFELLRLALAPPHTTNKEK